MSLLAELNTILTGLGLSVETGVFGGKAPTEYAVITPLYDRFEVHADNRPRFEVQEAMISLFSKNNYKARAREITSALLAEDVTITERKYVGYENDTGYHNYAIATEKEYPYGENKNGRG